MKPRKRKPGRPPITGQTVELTLTVKNNGTPWLTFQGVIGYGDMQVVEYWPSGRIKEHYVTTHEKILDALADVRSEQRSATEQPVSPSLQPDLSHLALD